MHNRERLNVEHALMMKFLFLIVLISHVRKNRDRMIESFTESISYIIFFFLSGLRVLGASLRS